MTALSTLAALPSAPGGLPVFGHTWPLLRDPLRFVTQLPAYGPLVTLRLGWARAVVVCDPTLTQQLLVRDRIFDRGGPFFDRAREAGAGNGLGTCPHRDHRRQRRLCQPAFRPDRINTYATVFAQATAGCISNWRDGQVLDVHPEMSSLALRMVLRTLYSSGLSDPELAETGANAVQMLEGLFRRTITPRWMWSLPTPAARRHERAQCGFRETAQRIIAARSRDGADHGDLLSALQYATDDDADPDSASRVLTAEELTDQVFTFLITGFETLANTLSWAMYLLAAHPDVQHQVHREATEAVSDGDLPGPEHLVGLEVTGRVIDETLRLYPQAWLLTRTVTEDAELGGCLLPAGTMVFFSSYLIHHRADLYPDPERFDPGRWRNKVRDRSTYLPFGSGPRKCIGDRFARTSLVLALAAIARRWQLTPTAPGPLRPAVRATLVPHALRLRLHARTVTSLDLI